MRLDIAMVQRGLTDTRSRATNAIKGGQVYVNGTVITKPAYDCTEQDNIEYSGDSSVGRGSLKLEHALDEFGISPDNMKALDIGASTGGFTQVLLERGAETVYAVDVGHDQLAPSLRTDSRVHVYEGVNARQLDSSIFYDFDIVTVDVSFISLKLILNSVYDALKIGGVCVALIKPQFEAGKKFLNKNGIVTDPQVHKRCVDEVSEFARQLGFDALGVTQSPIKGGKGNTEYLIHLVKRLNI